MPFASTRGRALPWLVCAALAAAGAARGRTLLFVDDGAVLYRAGTHRVFHPFQRYAGNPLLRNRERPWESAIGWMSVYRQPATGKYQLWYQATSGSAAQDPTRRSVVCYAESADGVAFTRPNLGLFDYNGDRNTSIVLVANGGAHDRYGASVVVDMADPNPARRYKMAYYDFTRDDAGVERPGLSVAFSPDGIHWTKYPHGPLVRTHYGNFGDPVPYAGETGRPWIIPLTMSDALEAVYDPPREVFAIYGKMWIDGPDGGTSWKHAMGRTESRDFIHWSQPRLVLTPDDDDPPYVEFHTAPVFYYEGVYFALLQILHRAESDGVIDVELGLSRDGLHWQRPFRKQLALPRGAPGAFDGGSMIVCGAPVILADEIRFYYAGSAGGRTGHDTRSWARGIGFATVRRDRFAGLRPDATSDQPTLKHPLTNIGQVTLKPIFLSPGTTLALNADAGEGSVRVEILDENGYRVRGFSREDAVPIRGDSLRHPVAWQGHALADLPAARYLLRLHLDQAEVFALTVNSPEPPRSEGVAGREPK